MPFTFDYLPKLNWLYAFGLLVWMPIGIGLNAIAYGNGYYRLIAGIYGYWIGIVLGTLVYACYWSYLGL